MTSLSSSLRDTVERCVPQLHQYCHDRFVIIGSAAAALAGAEVIVADLDVLTSVDDAERLREQWTVHIDAAYVPTHSELFRSHFARFTFSPMPVEIMGGLEFYDGESWKRVTVQHIDEVTCAGISVPIPAMSEQIALLERFARPKDRLRAELLRAQ